MKPRAACVRVMMFSAVVGLVGGVVDSAGWSDEWLASRPVFLGGPQGQATPGTTGDLRSTARASTTIDTSTSGPVSSRRTGESPREPGATLEPDLWTMLAGSLGLALFVAMRRL